MHIALDYYTKEDNILTKHQVFVSAPGQIELEDYVRKLLKKYGGRNEKCAVMFKTDRENAYLLNFNPETGVFHDMKEQDSCTVSMVPFKEDDVEETLREIGFLGDNETLADGYCAWKEAA